MKICFVVNSVQTETAGSTVYIMHQARRKNNEVYLMGVGDFSFGKDGALSIISTYLPKNIETESPEVFIDLLKGEKGKKKKIIGRDLDVLFIRNNPTEEGSGRQWAEQAGIAFGRLIQQEGDYYGSKISNRELETIL